MTLSPTTMGLATGTFLASAVECVEAFTIVLAMGLTRSWRAAVLGTIAALAVLAAVTALAGLALARWISESLLQLVIGTLLLIFGLQWLRKAILRSAGVQPLHQEEMIFAQEQEAARRAGREVRLGLVVVLAMGATLLRSGTVSAELVPLLVAAGIAVVVGVSLGMELRRSAGAIRSGRGPWQDR